jgi:4'-phosphopantetheinyl transferase
MTSARALLSPARVDVWVASLDDVDDARRQRYLAWLESDEKLKHQRFATERLKDEYLLTRALSRWVLSHYEPDVAPSAWRFERTDAGRPFVAGPIAMPSFNLANAGGLVVCAVSLRPVGVDVEPCGRGEELLATASRLFSTRENDDLARLDPQVRARRAVELWTLKEAYLKARGSGIDVRLERVTIVAAADASKRNLLGDASALGDDPLAWQLDVMDVPSCASGAFVVAVAALRGHEHDLSIRLTTVTPA